MSLLKPQKLNKGDTIALVSPSSGLASLFPHRLDNAIKSLDKLGFTTREFSTTRKISMWSAGTPQERTNDLISAFEDPSVKAIICTIGGMTSNQLLKHIDFDIVKKNPKIFCGYSDISVLHYAFHKKSRLITFYGPAAMTQFGDYPRLLHHTVEYFLKAVCNNKPISTISPSKEWTDEFLDWSKKLDIKRARRMRPNKGFEWLSEGKAKGPIIGGCLSSIIHLRGTDFWPSHKGCIMFLETPEGQDPSKGEPLSNIDSYLTDLELSGVFDEIKGLIFGRAFGYSEEDTNKLKSILINVGDEYSFPILYGADIGHTDPMITIPLGIKAVIDSENDLFTMQENGVK